MKSNDGFFIEVRRMIPTLSLTGIMVLFQFRVGLNLYVIPKRGIMRNGGPHTTTTSFRKWTPWTGMDKAANTYNPKVKVLDSYMLCENHMAH